jgi:hypothetical protein
MIEANELRIGNLALTPRKVIVSIERIIDTSFCALNKGSIRWYSKLNPIPITEEWLVSFGFFINNYESDNFGTTVYQFKNFAIYCNYSVNKWLVCYIDGVELESVHQLQNLYFALTGEELKLNEI